MAKVVRLMEEFKEDSPRTEVSYDCPEARVVRFFLKKGQEIRPHTSPSRVFIAVLKGRLIFTTGEEGREEDMSAGDTIFYDPKELHGFKALEDSVVEAFIVPNPTANRVKVT